MSPLEYLGFEPSTSAEGAAASNEVDGGTPVECEASVSFACCLRPLAFWEEGAWLSAGVSGITSLEGGASSADVEEHVAWSSFVSLSLGITRGMFVFCHPRQLILFLQQGLKQEVSRAYTKPSCTLSE